MKWSNFQGFLQATAPTFHKRRTARLPELNENELPNKEDAVQLTIDYALNNPEKLQNELLKIEKLINEIENKRYNDKP